MQTLHTCKLYMLNNTFFKVSLKSWSNTLTCIASAWLYELWKDIFKWKADFHEILFSFIHLFFHGKMNQFPKFHDFNSVTKLLTIKYSTFYANLANLFIRQKLQTFYWFLHFWKNMIFYWKTLYRVHRSFIKGHPYHLILLKDYFSSF